jgi:hypothetical protein
MAVADSPASAAASDSDNDSQHPDNNNKNLAQKDKECQYCHQKFTSSSLGRHLDQFISKKKPDGIHNVDEIRRLRGGITRRTARNSKKHTLNDHPVGSGNANTGTASSNASPAPAQFQEVPPDHLNSHAGGIVGSFNRLNWHSTGVITDPTSINPTPTAGLTPGTGNAVAPAAISSATSPSKKRSFSAYAADLRPSTTSSSTSPTALADTARALELSLREVLDTLRAATKHVNTPPTPFEFDLAAQTYPSLILKLLPVPQTIHQASPFSTLQSIPFSSPGPDQLTPLRNRLTYTIDRWKWNALRLAQRTTSNIADEASFLSSQADTYTSSALTHLHTCFENWMIHPPETRDALWHVELLRAFHAQRDKATEMEEKMESLQQEAHQLKQQVEYLSKCQWPREMALWPPDRLTYGKSMREEIRLINLQRPPYAVLKNQQQGGSGGNSGGNSGGPSASTAGASPRPRAYNGSLANFHRARSEGAPLEDSNHVHASETTDDDEDNPNMVTDNVNTRGDKWDFDKLVGKWRAHVKEDRQRRTPWGVTTTTSGAGTTQGTTAAGQSGVAGRVSASPSTMDASGASRGAANGAAGDGSPNTGVHAEGAANPGLGIRKDKPPFGKDNNVRILSDW